MFQVTAPSKLAGINKVKDLVWERQKNGIFNGTRVEHMCK